MGHLGIAMTLVWFQHTIPIPEVTTEEYLRQLALDLVHVLKDNEVSTPTKLRFGTPIFNTYQQVAEIFQQATTPPDVPPSKIILTYNLQF